MNNIHDIETLIDDYLRNTCTREEYDKIVEILNNPEYNSAVQFILSKKWSENETNDNEISEEDKKDIKQSLSNIHHEINLIEEHWESRSRFKKISRVLLNIAATLLLPVLFFSIWYFFNTREYYQSTDSFITLNTPAGSKLRSQLPDGTVVWLNSASTIKYPQNYTKRNRQVILTGEAYFEVSSDKLHPFFVKTKDLLIAVTGTKFNVNGYDDEETSSVVLEKGIISVKSLNSSSSQQYQLVQGDKLESTRTQGLLLEHGIDVKKYVSWINGKLIFRDDPLGEVLKKLSRWYNVEIVVNDPKGMFIDLPFNMTIQNESLPQILEYLKRAVPISIKEEKLILKGDGSFNKQKYIIDYKKRN
jgi:transmembrane sensor